MKKTSKPNRANFLKLADKLFSDVIINGIIYPETAGRMLGDYLEEIIKLQKESQILFLELNKSIIPFFFIP